MAKHLFRIRILDMEGDDDWISEERLSDIDGDVRKFFPVHTVKTTIHGVKKDGFSIYGRDQISEWNNRLIVRPGFKSSSFMPDFKKTLSSIGYKKKIEEAVVLHEGGLFVNGKKFILFSDLYEDQSDELGKDMQEMGVKKDVYFLKCLTNLGGEHIDLDYAVIDAAKVIYYSRNVAHSRSVSYASDALEKIKSVAKKVGYQPREFKYGYDESKMNKLKLKKYTTDLIERWMSNLTNGINLIVDDRRILTSYIHPEERRFLEKSGIDVIEVDGQGTGFGGLRCLYGELTV